MRDERETEFCEKTAVKKHFSFVLLQSLQHIGETSRERRTTGFVVLLQRLAMRSCSVLYCTSHLIHPALRVMPLQNVACVSSEPLQVWLVKREVPANPWGLSVADGCFLENNGNAIENPNGVLNAKTLLRGVKLNAPRSRTGQDIQGRRAN